MNFKKKNISLIIGVLGILVFCFLTFFFYYETEYWMMSLWCGLLVSFFVYSLNRTVNKTKSELLSFLVAIEQSEFTGTYKFNKKRDDLYQIYERLTNIYKKLSTEKETNHLYLKTIVEHVSVALLCFDAENNIVIFNNEAKNLFGRSFIININTIERIDAELAEILLKIKSGERKMHHFQRKDVLMNISIQATEFKINNKPHKLISLHDIKSELERQELSSWKKLVRVLTHEIMNTAIPISTLASVTSQILVDKKGNNKKLNKLNDEDEEDLRLSLKTIERRSKGIVDFVKATKNYTQIPDPVFDKVSAETIISTVLSLLKADLDSSSIKIITTYCKPIPWLYIDKKLIEQVLINILRNAMEANLKSRTSKIEINIIRTDNYQTRISISDNGAGIDSEVMENIFVPFFTTKKEGSGIGLSLSRQIMLMHNGQIQIQTSKGEGTQVDLYFIAS